MNSLLNFTSEFSVMSLYSLILGLLLFCVTQIFRSKSFIKIWRDFWLVLIILCVFPLLLSFTPNFYQDLSFFDVNQLQFSGGETHTINTIKEVVLSDNESKEFSVLSVVFILWTFVYIFGLAYALKCFYQKLRLIKTIIENSDSTNDKNELISPRQFQQFKKIQNSKNLQVYLSPLNISPFVYQGRKQYLVLPHGLFKKDNLSQDQINLIIEHELNHIKNKDQLVVLISHIMTCVLWFNPFVKSFQQSMGWAIEAHCDSEVLRQKPHLRKIYAQTMLKILRQSATTTSNHMVAAFSTKTHRSLTMRINNIMKPLHPEVKFNHKKKKLWLSAAIMSCAMFITQPQSFAASEKNKVPMLNPVIEAKVTSLYGANNKFHQFHKGIDLGAKIDTPIVAASNGVVRVSTDLLENRKNYGTLIIIDHDDGFHSVYAHLNSRNVAVGEKVIAGQLIGHVGETGKATGPHLHLELLKDNKHVNPSDYIQF
ncbi:MAG: M56 family metallopeptidase [Marinicellaceae bacterium]